MKLFRNFVCKNNFIVDLSLGYRICNSFLFFLYFLIYFSRNLSITNFVKLVHIILEIYKLIYFNYKIDHFIRKISIFRYTLNIQTTLSDIKIVIITSLVYFVQVY